MMGVHENISYDKFPKQGKYAGKQVEVCFNYDASRNVKGFVVRDDEEAPFIRMFQLVDGRIVLDTECQFSFV